jgi:hypothetical protein
VSVRRIAALLLALVPTWACEESEPNHPDAVPADAAQRYAVARCDAMFACTCGATGFTDRDACVEATAAGFDEMAMTLDGVGARFDLDCLEESIAYWQSEDACRAPPDASPTHCDLFAGDRLRGEPCDGKYTIVFGADDCAGELYCTAGSCVPAMELWIDLNEGDACGAAGSRCANGLFCDPSTSSCALVLAEGEACTVAEACRFDLFCRGLAEGTGECTRLLDPGAACDPADPEPCTTVSTELGEGVGAACIESICQPWQPWACGVAPLPAF